MHRTSSALLATVLLVTACGSGDGDEPVSGRSTGSSTTSTIRPASDHASTTEPSTTPSSTTPPATSEPATATPATAAPATTAPPTTQPEPVPWTAVGPGPYRVGVTTVTIDDPADDRPLTVEVWFPVTGGTDATGLSPHRYTLLPTAYYESPVALEADASLLSPDGPFPLVVYSHGSGGVRFLHSSFAEAVASHGHVVVAADHIGNTVLERFTGAGATFEENAFNRPNDVRRLIDAFVDTGHPAAGPFAASIDTERIAVTGHSAGGYTAIAVATGVSTPLGDVPPDPRVDALALFAPAVGASVDDGMLRSLRTPMMVVVGTNDTTTPVDPNVTRLWDGAVNTPAYRVELVAGAHQTFTDLCAYADALPTVPDIPQVVIDTIIEFGAEGCSPGDIDAERAAELTNSYVIRFLDEIFRDGPPIDPEVMATPDDVRFDRR